MTYIPSFKCEYCGEPTDASIFGDHGTLVPCSCKEARDARDREHYLLMQRRRAARSK